MISIIAIIRMLFRTIIGFVARVTMQLPKVFTFAKLRVYDYTASFVATIHSVFMLPTLLRK